MPAPLIDFIVAGFGLATIAYMLLLAIWALRAHRAARVPRIPRPMHARSTWVVSAAPRASHDGAIVRDPETGDWYVTYGADREPAL